MPQVLAALVVVVLAWGTVLALNSHDRVSFLPAALDRAVAWRTLVPLGAVLFVTLALIDLARRPVFRVIGLWVVAVNGAGVAAVGALARAHVVTVFHHPGHLGGTPFAAFGYHGNAAAYLNLVLPAALVLVFVEYRWSFLRVVAGLVAAVILAGCATQASKAGLLFSVAILIVFAVVMARQYAQRARESGSRGSRSRVRAVTAALVGVALVVGIVGAVSFRSRWAELPDELGGGNGRAEIWQVALDVWQDHPIAGAGPGSFKLLIPSVAAAQQPGLFPKWIVTEYRPGHPVTIWMYAHDDPLQTLAEWGVIGVVLLGAILLWPIGCAFLLRPRGQTDRVVRAGAVIALGALYLHSLIDFPLQILAIELTAGVWAAILIGMACEASGAALEFT